MTAYMGQFLFGFGPRTRRLRSRVQVVNSGEKGPTEGRFEAKHPSKTHGSQHLMTPDDTQLNGDWGVTEAGIRD